ncbi:MAG: hypothetical protein LBQ27_02865 [Clostridiales bacterium]|nr:hypothetical protein [Clostridiales bacterium]
MLNLTLKKENIIAVMSFRENNEVQAELLSWYARNKRAFFFETGTDIKSLIIYDAADGAVCYAVATGVRSIIPRLEKNLFLNI